MPLPPRLRALVGEMIRRDLIRPRGLEVPLEPFPSGRLRELLGPPKTPPPVQPELPLRGASEPGVARLVEPTPAPTPDPETIAGLLEAGRTRARIKALSESVEVPVQPELPDLLPAILRPEPKPLRLPGVRPLPSEPEPPARETGPLLPALLTRGETREFFPEKIRALVRDPVEAARLRARTQELREGLQAPPPVVGVRGPIQPPAPAIPHTLTEAATEAVRMQHLKRSRLLEAQQAKRQATRWLEGKRGRGTLANDLRGRPETPHDWDVAQGRDRLAQEFDQRDVAGQGIQDRTARRFSEGGRTVETRPLAIERSVEDMQHPAMKLLLYAEQKAARQADPKATAEQAAERAFINVMNPPARSASAVDMRARRLVRLAQRIDPKRAGELEEKLDRAFSRMTPEEWEGDRSVPSHMRQGAIYAVHDEMTRAGALGDQRTPVERAIALLDDQKLVSDNEGIKVFTDTKTGTPQEYAGEAIGVERVKGFGGPTPMRGAEARMEGFPQVREHRGRTIPGDRILPSKPGEPLKIKPGLPGGGTAPPKLGFGVGDVVDLPDGRRGKVVGIVDPTIENASIQVRPGERFDASFSQDLTVNLARRPREQRGGKWGRWSPVLARVELADGSSVTVRQDRVKQILPAAEAVRTKGLEAARAELLAQPGQAFVPRNQPDLIPGKIPQGKPPVTKGTKLVLTKIITGGQTGGDRAGLEIARELGLQTGGTAPRGWRTNKGPDPSLKDFGLVEHRSSEYPPRTRENVANADATVGFGNMNSPGMRLTAQLAAKLRKPFLANPTPEQLRAWLVEHQVKTLNVSGNRAETNPKVVELTKSTIRKAWALKDVEEPKLGEPDVFDRVREVQAINALPHRFREAESKRGEIRTPARSPLAHMTVRDPSLKQGDVIARGGSRWRVERVRADGLALLKKLTPGVMLAGAGYNAISQLVGPTDKQEGESEGETLEAGLLPRVFRPRPPMPKGVIPETARVAALQQAERAKVPTPARKKALWQTHATNSLAHLENITRLLQERGASVDPENTTLHVLGPRLRGGLGGSEAVKQDLQANVVDPFRDKVAANGRPFQEILNEYLNLTAYGKAWELVEGKAAKIRLEAGDLRARGFGEQADQLLRDNSDLFRNIADKTVVPEKLDPARIREGQRLLIESLQPGEQALVRRAADSVYKASNWLLNRYHEEEILSDKEFATYRDRKHHIPLYRIMQLFDEKTGKFIEEQYLHGKASPIPRSKVRLSLLDETELSPELRGSDRPNINPLEALYQYLDRGVTEIERNRTARTILKEIEANSKTIGDVYKLKRIGNRPIDEDKLPPELRGMVQVGYYEKGEPVYYLVDQDTGMAMRRIDADSFRAGGRIARATKVLFQSLAATYNPAFISKQLLVDPASALLLTDWNKHKQGGLARDIAGTFFPTLGKTIWRELVTQRMRRQSPAAEAKWQAYQKEMIPFRESGAASAPLGVRRGIREELWGWKPEGSNRFVRGAERAAHVLDRFIQQPLLEPIEKGVKSATWHTLMKREYGPTEAAYQTRLYGGSPDFLRMGVSVRGIRDVFMFINPQIQGIARMGDRLHLEPGRMARLAGILGAAVIAADKWNEQFKDEEGNPEIFDAPDDQLRQNLYLFLPGEKQLQANGQLRQPAIKIPLSHELQVILGPAIAFVNRKDPNVDWGNEIANAVGNFLPGGTRLEADRLPQSLFRRVAASTTPLVRWPLEAWSGQNFSTGAPIVGSRVAGRTPSMQFTPRTDPTAKAIGQKLGISPDRLQHAIQSFFPGLGEMALTAGQLVNPRPQLAEDSGEALVRTPIIGPMARRFFDPGLQSQKRLSAWDEYAEARKRSAEAVASLRPVARRNREEYAKLIAREPLLRPLAAAHKGFARFDDAFAKLDARREALQTDPSLQLSPTARRAELQRLQQQEEAVMAKAQAYIQRLKQKGWL